MHSKKTIGRHFVHITSLHVIAFYVSSSLIRSTLSCSSISCILIIVFILFILALRQVIGKDRKAKAVASRWLYPWLRSRKSWTRSGMPWKLEMNERYRKNTNNWLSKMSFDSIDWNYHSNIFQLSLDCIIQLSANIVHWIIILQIL